MNNKNQTYLLPLGIALVLFISIFKLPYGFYTFARIIVCGASVFLTWLMWAFNNGMFSFWQVPTVLIAVLWNPVTPIYLDKGTWRVLDIVGIVVCIAESIYVYLKSNK